MNKNKEPTRLTDKQERFCIAIAKGDKQSDAYKGAYNAVNMTDKTIIEKASKLMAQDNIRARCEELRSKVVAHMEKEAIFTVESVLNDIKELIERNKETDDRVALEGMKTVAKHLGMFVERVEHSGKIEMPTIVISK